MPGAVVFGGQVGGPGPGTHQRRHPDEGESVSSTLNHLVYRVSGFRVLGLRVDTSMS